MKGQLAELQVRLKQREDILQHFARHQIERLLQPKQVSTDLLLRSYDGSSSKATSVVSHGNRELQSLTNGSSSFFDQSLDLKCILPVSIEGKWTCGVPDQHSEDTSQKNAGHESIQHGLTPTPYITSTVEGAVSASTRNRQLAPRRIPIAIS
jgi:hypothetical protein